MGSISSNVKCCFMLLGLLALWSGNCEAGGFDPLGPLVRLLKPHPHPPPPPPPPLRTYFYPQPGPITSILPPYIHAYGAPVYAATKFVVARNHHHGLPPLHLQDPDLVRFFYQQAPAFFNVPSLSSLYALPHGPPTFFDYPGGFGSFEKYTGPSTTFSHEEAAPGPVSSDGGYGPPSTVAVASDEYESPSSGGYSSPVSSGGYGAPSLVGYESSSGGYGSSSIVGAGGYGSGSSSSAAGGGYDPSSGGFGGPSGDGGGNANAGSGDGAANAGPNPNSNPTGFNQNQAPYDGSNPQETGPSGRASSDRQEDARPRPAGAAADGGNESSQRLTNGESDFQDEPEADIGFRSLTSGSFQKPERKEKGRKTTSSTNDEFDEPKPTKDPFKSSPFLSQYIDSSQYQKKHSSKDTATADEPIQFRSPLSDADLFDYGDELIDTAAGGEKTNFRPKQQKKNEVVANKGGSAKQNNKKKITNVPNQDQVFFDEVDDRRNAGSSSKEESDPKPTVDYEQPGTTGASFTNSGEQKSGPVKPTPTSGGYSSSTTSRGSSSSTTTEGGYDDVKPTDGVYEDSTSTAKNGNFGAKIRSTSPTSSSSSAGSGPNNNRQKKAAQARQTQNQRSRH